MSSVEMNRCRAGKLTRRWRDLEASFLAMIGVAVAIVVLLVAFDRFIDSEPARTVGRVEPSRFALVRDGMAPSEVRALIGPPATTAVNPAEGLRSEPPATCWHYIAADQMRAYSVCFVDRLVVTRGSYLMEGSELP
jgi:hypothetical protein